MELRPQQFTVLGWDVDDIVVTVQWLASRGVEFERYLGMGQDAHGIWKTPGGQVAWFKDPFGNTPSVSKA